jgi:BlaI family penicillinase repressor
VDARAVHVGGVPRSADGRASDEGVHDTHGALEEKGYVAHETSGRTFIYRAAEARQNVAARAVKSIIDRFCGGSAEQLVIGMVDNEVLDRKVLERLTQKIRKGSDK